MYEEFINSKECKATLDLTWYKGSDLYSDGDIENVIIDIIMKNEPEDYTEAIANQFCWPTYYHLTHIRKNIINWYPFRPDASVLEIGCGFGAITSELCDRCGDVTAVELSKRRATGALLRCRNKDNLRVIVANINDIEFNKKFDYITLIGVLEYQGKYTDTDNPYCDFLKKIKSLLKPDGRLLIAIENQFGLKYWCGAVEDHTGVPFEGMNKYYISGNGVRTFSRAELDNLVKSSGYKNTYFYYPMPDYKLPTVVYSDEYLPKNGNMLDMRYYYIPNSDTLVANESVLYDDIVQNKVFPFFANSFLVECSDSEDIGEIIFASLSCKRVSEYRIGTKLNSKGQIIKFCLISGSSNAHLKQILLNEKELAGSGINILRSNELGEDICTTFVDSPTIEEKILDYACRREVDEMIELIDKAYIQMLNSSEQVDWQDNIVYTLGLNFDKDEYKYGPILKNGFIDMIARNAFVVDNDIIWFDQEWKLENVPAKYLMFRFLTVLYHSYDEVLSKVISLKELMIRYELFEIWDELEMIERLFIGSVLDKTHIIEEQNINHYDSNNISKNIYNIMNLKEMGND